MRSIGALKFENPGIENDALLIICNAKLLTLKAQKAKLRNDAILCEYFCKKFQQIERETVFIYETLLTLNGYQQTV